MQIIDYNSFTRLEIKLLEMNLNQTYQFLRVRLSVCLRVSIVMVMLVYPIISSFPLYIGYLESVSSVAMYIYTWSVALLQFSKHKQKLNCPQNYPLSRLQSVMVTNFHKDSLFHASREILECNDMALATDLFNIRGRMRLFQRLDNLILCFQFRDNMSHFFSATFLE